MAVKQKMKNLCGIRLFHMTCVSAVLILCLLAVFGGRFPGKYVIPIYVDQSPVVSNGQKVPPNQNSRVYDLNYKTGQHMKWRKISIYEIFDNFRPKTLDSCVNQCEENDTMCSINTFKGWNDLIQKNRYPPVALVEPYRYIYSFEKDYLSKPPLNDLKTLPNLTLSRVFIPQAKGNVVTCQINDVVTGRVDLIDGYGKQRKEGGDDVRVWLVGTSNKATGQPFDLRNGSYAFSFKCLWSGITQLKISVAYPREFIRAAIYGRYIGKKRAITGTFKKGEIEEVTICFSMPNIAGRPCLCNLTEINQRSFYCGRPLDSRLSCRDWIGTHALASERLINSEGITDAERYLLTHIPGPASARSIKHKFTVNVSSSGKLHPLTPCSNLNSSVTWTEGCKGYWSSGFKWNSLLCQAPPSTQQWISSCLKNTNIWIIGDSNGVRLFGSINKVLPSSLTVKPGSWPYQAVKRNSKSNTTVTFTPHEYPLHLGNRFTSKLPYGGVAKQIDAIPSKGKQILVFHYYLHIIVSHLIVGQKRLEAARDAVARLFKRNPDAYVAFRGPHTSSEEMKRNHAMGGDTLGLLYLHIIREVFHNFKDKIIFLDGWEMSISIENKDFHPTYQVPDAMVKLMLAFICK